MFFKAKKELLTAMPLSDVLFVFPFYHTGGAEKVHLKVALEAVECGLKPVFVFTGKSASDTYKTQFQKLGTVIDIGFRYDNMKLNDGLLAETVDAINQSGLKVVFGSNSSFYYQILFKIKKSNLKVIDLVHAYNPPFEVSNVYFKDVFSKINTRIFVNEPSLLKMKNFYRSDLPKLDSSQFRLIYNSVFGRNAEPAFPTSKENDGVFKIIFVARNSPEKRPRIAFEVAKRLTGMYPGKYRFFMVGDFDPYKSNNSSKDVSIISGLKDADEIIKLYQAANCLILTSETEGFPLVISEAMFYSAVPVSTDVGGIPYVLKDSENALLVNSLLDEESIVIAFCEKIMLLSSNDAYCRKLSSAAFETAKSNFSYSGFSENYRALFQ